MERGTSRRKNGWQSCSVPWPEIGSILFDDSEEGRRLRQSDPFSGILTPAERWEIYREAARDEAAMSENSR